MAGTGLLEQETSTESPTPKSQLMLECAFGKKNVIVEHNGDLSIRLREPFLTANIDTSTRDPQMNEFVKGINSRFASSGVLAIGTEFLPSEPGEWPTPNSDYTGKIYKATSSIRLHNPTEETTKNIIKAVKEADIFQTQAAAAARR